MKRLKYAVILLLGLSMATMMISCNKESNYQNRIIGKWQMTKETFYNYDLTGALVSEDMEEFPDNENYRWEFLSDGMVRTPSWYWQKSIMSDYLIKGDSLFIKLQWWDEFEEQNTFTIQELTNSTMEWEREYVSSYSNCKYVYRYEFKKVK